MDSERPVPVLSLAVPIHRLIARSGEGVEDLAVYFPAGVDRYRPRGRMKAGETFKLI